MSFKINEKKKLYISTTIWMVITLLVIGLLLFGIRMLRLNTLKLDEGSTCVDEEHNWSGNYIAVCEDIGPKFLNGILGERLKLLSIPDGKEYVVSNNLGLFDGFANPIICGDKIFFNKTWLDYTEEYYQVEMGKPFSSQHINCNV